MSDTPRARDAIDGAIPEAVLQEASRVLRVLTHPQRLRLCEMLLRQRLSVGELAAQSGLQPNAVSQHLSFLRAHGVLEARRDGRSVYYEVVHPGPQWLLTCIRRYKPVGRASSVRRARRR